MAKPTTTIRWLAQPEPHNYPAAHAYLNLIYDDIETQTLVSSLRKAPIAGFKAKDIFRASGLSLLGISNSHVKKDKKKILAGKKLSPLLLVRDREHRKLVIADGYHRLCSVYSFDEDAVIACKIV